MGQAIPQYILVKSPLPWLEARRYCQQHYLDLAVLNTEEEYFTLLNVTALDKASFWLGLKQLDTSVGWKWVDGEVLVYDKWYKTNYNVHCASLEAMLGQEKKLLGRFCDERHMFVCQGPVSPQPVNVDSVSSSGLVLSWNISAFMQMTPHSYKVEICADTCEALIYPYTNSSTVMTINISNLTSGTEFFINVSAFVMNDTGRDVILQSLPSALRVKTMESYEEPRVILIILKLLKLVSLAPPLWIVYNVLKKNKMKRTDLNLSTGSELTTLELQVDPTPERHRGIG